MSVYWKKGNYDKKSVFTKLNNAKHITETGKVTFQGLMFTEYILHILGMLEFSEDIPNIVKRRLLSQAVFSAGKSGEISATKVFTILCKLEYSFRNSESRRYVLTTTISIDKRLKIPNFNFRGAKIIFSPTLHNKFANPLEKLLPKTKKSLFTNYPDNYMSVKVYISANSIYIAAEKALDYLNIIRGIWNLNLNIYSKRRISSTGVPNPVNRIILGPFHFLHNIDGSLATDEEWWYEPSFIKGITPFIENNKDTELIISDIRNIKQLLNKHKYKDEISQALIRYANALDDRDWTNSFMKLWSLLEYLTDSIGKYDKLIRRVSFSYIEHDYQKNVLENLREIRNSVIHNDGFYDEIETYLYLLKNNVEYILDFHLVNKYKFESIQKAAMFLDSPYKEDDINEEIENCKTEIRKHTQKIQMLVTAKELFNYKNDISH